MSIHAVAGLSVCRRPGRRRLVLVISGSTTEVTSENVPDDASDD